MNSDDFQVRYRLLKVVSLDDGIRTHNAQETTTGRVVMVHLVYDASPEAIDRLRSILSRLPIQDKARILETATLPAGYAIVSEFIPGLTSFSAWLSAHATESPSEGFDGAQGGGAPMFAAPTAPAAPYAASPAPAPMPPPAPLPPMAAAPAAPAQPPGEFTQMFMKGDAAPPKFTPSPAPRPVTPPAAPPPPAMAPPMAPPAAPPAMSPMAATVATPAPRPVAPPAAPPPPPPLAAPTPMPVAAPGEFTQMFSKSGFGGPATPSHSTPFGTPATPAPQPPHSPSGQSPMMGYSSGSGAGAPLPPPMAPPPMMSPPSAPPLPPRFDPPSFASPPTPTPVAPPSWGAPVDRLGASNAPPPISPMAGPGAGATGTLDARRGSGGMNPAPPPIMGGPPPLAQPPMASSPMAPSPHVPPMLPPPVFQAQNPSGLGAQANSPLAGGSQQPANAAAGPSDYTMMITRGKGTSVPPAAAKPAPAPAPVAAAKPKIPLPLLIGLNVIVVLTLAIVLYFGLRPKPTVSLPNKPKVTAPALPK